MLANAQVQIQDSRGSTISDRQGNYRLIGLESPKSGQHTITVVVSATGYQQASKLLNI